MKQDVIAHNVTTKTKKMKTTFLKQSIAILIIAVSALSANAQKKQGDKLAYESRNTSSTYMYFDDDSTVNPPQTTVTYCENHIRYEFTLSSDKLTELYINNHKIPADSFYLYNALVTKLKEQIKRDRIQAEEDRKQAALDRVQAEEDRKQAVRDQAQAEEDRKQAEKDRQQAEVERQESVKDQQQAVEDRKQAERDRMQADQDRKQAELDRQQAVRDQAQAVEDRKQAELDRKQAEEDRKIADSLVSDIIAEHIVANKAGIREVILNEDEFIVNGKLQSEELLKKFKAKYVKKAGYSVRYGGTTSSYGIYINN